MGVTTSKRSQTGTKCTEVKRRRASSPESIKYNDLSKLLVAAGEAGVSELVFQDLSVKFYEKLPKEDVLTEGSVALLSVGGNEDIAPPIESFVTKSHDEPLQEVVTSQEDRARLRELEREYLMLDDPIEFENLNIDLLMGNDIHA